jgi:diacylglycerol kinase family enzyme
VTLIYNPTAGDEDHGESQLLELLEGAGHEVELHQAKRRKLGEALAGAADLIVAAGGDGTVGKVMIGMVDSPSARTPLAILPIGTANNIATSLETGGELADLVAGWPHARRRRVNLGSVWGASGRLPFVEAAGLGVMARVLTAVHKEGATVENLEEARNLFRQQLAAAEPVEWRGTFDGEDVSGHYLLLEAMNMGRIGPGLLLAPGADPGDDLLDLVQVTENERDLMLDYLASDGADPPPLPVRRGHRLHGGRGQAALHVDDEAHGGDGVLGVAGTVEIAIDRCCVEVLVPHG